MNEAFMVEMFSEQLNWNIKSGSMATLVRQNRKESLFPILHFDLIMSLVLESLLDERGN